MSDPTKSNPTPTTDASIAAASTSTAAAEGKKDDVPQLGALEEDDEFEEFAEQDWSPSETSLAHLPGKGGAPAAGASDTAPTASTTSHLWEDNWDDDDVEEDFGKQLRAELEKKNGATAMST